MNERCCTSFDRFLVNNRGKRRLMGKRHVASTLKTLRFFRINNDSFWPSVVN
jgi:hypothetical protein